MHILEQDQRISDSKIWTILQNFYLHNGLSAWSQLDVPYYVTSGGYVADYYAHIISQYILSLIETGQHIPSVPIYIIELGAGSGRLAFYCLKKLIELIPDDVRFCYVLTDIADKNIAAWQSCHAFDQYYAKNQVDFAKCDATILKPLSLIRSRVQLSSQLLKNPVIVIANYVFDSLPCDVFKVQNNTLLQARVMLQVPETFDIARPTDLKLVKCSLCYQKVNAAEYYPETIFNQILSDYTKNLNHAEFTFPITALRYLDYVAKLANDKLFLLSSDLGYSNLTQIDGNQDFDFNFLNFVYVHVNYHAIEQFVIKKNGEAFYKDRNVNLISVVYITENKMSHLKLLHNYLHTSKNQLSPLEFYALIQQVQTINDDAEIAINALIRLSQNDPLILTNLISVLEIELNRNENFKKEFSQKFKVILTNRYPLIELQQDNYVYGMLAFFLKDYQTAVTFLKQYKPEPAQEINYLSMLKSCYQVLQQEEAYQKVIMQLQQRSWKSFFEKLRITFTKLNKIVGRGLRIIIYLLVIVVGIYLVFKI